MSYLEMPVPCDMCGEWVELNSTRESKFQRKKMFCKSCSSTESEVKVRVEEIEDIQLMLDNNDP